MRHRIAHRHLNRDSAHRGSLLINLTKSLVQHEQIVTTLPKAKELRRFIEPLVTRAKTAKDKNVLHARRILLSRIRDRQTVEKLMSVLGPRYASRPGGYTRVMRAGFRRGDNAPVGVIEFVDRDESAKGSPQLSSDSADAGAA